MNILFVCGREPLYTRNSVILKGLRKNGVKVHECTSTLTSYLLRYPSVLAKFLFKRSDRSIDLVFIGFFGQPLVPLIKKITDKPILFDAFISAYDTLCFERKTFSPNSVAGKLTYVLDATACKFADHILLDTNSHINYFVKTFSMKKENFSRVFVGADGEIFHPKPKKSKGGNDFLVFYYGTYRPLQGIEYIVKAAKILEKENIIFKIVGTGITHPQIMKLSKQIGIKNISFVRWVSYTMLPYAIAEADICLGGHFSTIQKASRVIAGKTFQFIAMKKPVIVGDCPANRELFEHRKNAYLCPLGDEKALAEAIQELYVNTELREKIAEAGYRTFKRHCSVEVIGRRVLEKAQKLCK